jgi:hypothetical protein
MRIATVLLTAFILTACSTSASPTSRGPKDKQVFRVSLAVLSEKELTKYVGKRVEVDGFLNIGKPGWCACSGRNPNDIADGPVVYVEQFEESATRDPDKLNSLFSGKERGIPVQITGVLRFFEGLDAKSPAEQGISAHFHMDIAESEVTFVAK